MGPVCSKQEGAGMAWGDGDYNVVHTGGYGMVSGYGVRAWVWDGRAWKGRNSEGRRALCGHGMAYDA